MITEFATVKVCQDVVIETILFVATLEAKTSTPVCVTAMVLNAVNFAKVNAA